MFELFVRWCERMCGVEKRKRRQFCRKSDTTTRKMITEELSNPSVSSLGYWKSDPDGCRSAYSSRIGCLTSTNKMTKETKGRHKRPITTCERCRVSSRICSTSKLNGKSKRMKTKCEVEEGQTGCVRCIKMRQPCEVTDRPPPRFLTVQSVRRRFAKKLIPKE